MAGWTPSAARRTWSALGLQGRVRVAALPGAFPRVRSGDVVVAGWSLNELDEEARLRTLERLVAARQAGAGLLLVEPLSTRVSPWWPAALAALQPHGAREALVRVPVDLPAWLARLDQATGLDHRELGARALGCPPT